MASVGCYLRVSTEEQNFDRQLMSTRAYADRALEVDRLGDLRHYRDKSTGTNTDRNGYRELMADAEAGDLEAVVVHDLSRICRSVRDLDGTAQRLREAGVELHIISEGLVLRPGDEDPYQKALFQVLGVFAEMEASMAQTRTKEGLAARMESDDYHHGPAPLGFEKDDGELVEGDDYHDVVAVLDMVQKGNLSKRKASKRLDCARTTISRALDRPELYGV